MDTVLIVLIVTLGVIFVVWLLRDRITRLFVKSSGWEGGMDAAPPSHQLPNPKREEPASPEPNYSVDFSDNEFSGRGGTFRVSRNSFRAKKNKIRGDRDFIFEDSKNQSQNDTSQESDRDV